jgi:hypothetical protein
MKLLAALLVGFGLLSGPLNAALEIETDLKLVTLHNGLNAVDVNSDGRADMIVVARRENYNAHGFEFATIYIWAAATKDGDAALQIVPVRPAPEGEHDDIVNLRSGGGADALLTDFRLFLDPAHHIAVVVTANRRFGESFADVQPVDFEFFKLTRNEEEVPGLPVLYFKSYKKSTSKKPHQDVNEAFSSELGISSDGRQPE